MSRENREEDSIHRMRDGAVLRLEIRREHRGNSIDPAAASTLLRTLNDAAREPDLLAVIIGSQGTQFFCTGGDTKEYANLNREELAAQFETMTRVCQTIEHFPVPVIAAISGAAVGGGVELALACDMRIASREAWFQFPNVGLGVITAWGGGQRLRTTVGRSKAIEMIVFSGRVKADEAASIGLIDHVVEDPDAFAADLVKQASDPPRVVIEAAKSHLDSSMPAEAVSEMMLDLWFEHGLIHARENA